MSKSIDGLRTKWGAFKAVIRATWLWRVYGICTMKRPWISLLAPLIFGLTRVVGDKSEHPGFGNLALTLSNYRGHNMCV